MKPLWMHGIRQQPVIPDFPEVHVGHCMLIIFSPYWWLSYDKLDSHRQIARNPGNACSTSAWNRKATGSYDGVTPTLVYMAFA